MSPNESRINVDGRKFDSGKLRIGNDEADGRLCVKGTDEEEGMVDSEGAVLFVGCVEGLGNAFKKGVLLLDGIPLRVFDGLVLRNSCVDSDRAINLVGWAGVFGLGLNERLLVMDRMSLNEC